MSQMKALEAKIAALEDDIARLEAEKAHLKQKSLADSLLAETVKQSKVAFAAGQLDGTVFMVNEAFCALTGYNQSELRQLNWSTDLTPEAWLAKETTYIQRLLETGQPQSYTKEYRHKTGQTIPVEMQIQAMTDEYGDLEYIFAFVQDISEQEMAAQQLQASELRYRTLINTIPYGIFEWDLQGRITFCNQAYEKMLGYGPGEAIHQHIWDCLPSKTAQTELAAKLQADLNQQNKPTAYQLQAQTTQGQPLALQIAWNYRLNEANELEGFIGVMTDVTARNQAQAEKEALKEEIIFAQQEVIEALATPIIPLMERIIVLPIVGSIDSQRARQLMRSLLKGIGQYRAKVVILDVTGVAMIDTDVIGHLDKTLQAARLKGATPIVTGLSNNVVESIVNLGIDWQHVQTLRNLESGLKTALTIMGYELCQPESPLTPNQPNLLAS